jgi:hypothetical protein
MASSNTKLSVRIAKVVAALVLAAGAASSHALALLGQAPDPSVIVSAGGYEWVHAGPCAGLDPSCGVVLLHHGFDFATDAEWLASFASIGDLTTAFTGKCASTYFNTVHDHCDIGDAAAGFIWHSPLAPDAFHRDHPLAETFLIRRVPEPSVLSLLALALDGFGFARGRKQ